MVWLSMIGQRCSSYAIKNKFIEPESLFMVDGQQISKLSVYDQRQAGTSPPPIQMGRKVAQVMSDVKEILRLPISDSVHLVRYHHHSYRGGNNETSKRVYSKIALMIINLAAIVYNASIHLDQLCSQVRASVTALGAFDAILASQLDCFLGTLLVCLSLWSCTHRERHPNQLSVYEQGDHY